MTRNKKKSKKNILFIVDHRLDRSPGQRFGFEQYLRYLENEGYMYTISNLLNEKDDRIFYSKGNIPGKIRIALKVFMIRVADVLRCRRYSHIFIYRYAWFFGSTIFEWLFKKLSGAKLIYHFDDAIWVPVVSKGYRWIGWLKGFNKTGKIISLCDVSLAGNEYLATYSRKFNKNTIVIPATIDTEEYTRTTTARNSPGVVIGWSGSKTTIQHFATALPWLRRVYEKYGNVRIEVIGDENYRVPELNIVGKPWRKKDEVSEICGFDIGIMPLPDDEWTRGKCGLKGLQYMALGVPTIMSPVAVNNEIIQDGINGFLAGSDAEWIEKVTRLIESPDLRKRIGSLGRQTVVDRYSVLANKDKWLAVFDAL